MKRIFPVLVVLSCFLFLFKPALGQVDSTGTLYAVTDTQNVKVTLFDTDEIFEITLKFDISYYKKQRSDVEYLDAVLTYYNSKTDSVTKNIKVKARGETRRTYLCDFPPLLLNFKMKDSKGTEFKGINKLKLVPYCRVGYEKYILKEYLVYKLYNLLTDLSFRVRLCRVTYINTAKPKKPMTQFGFVIEPVSLLERRTKTKEITYTGASQRTVKQEILDRAAIFNYMIGNTDWSVPAHHNILMLYDPKSEYSYENVIVPFDFDYAGFVDTDYAVPFETLPIKTVQERLYMAVCRSEADFKKDLATFYEKKDAFYKVINDFPYLNPRDKKALVKFLSDFFFGIEKKDITLKKLLVDCRWFEERAGLRQQ